MQLLVEEFFKKVFDYINGMNLFVIRWAVKLIFYVVLAGIIAYIILSALRHNYFPVFILLGILLIGEIAHYLRKSREKVIKEKITEKNSVVKKPENKRLLKINKPKNDDMLKVSKPKNKEMLKKKVKKSLIKTGKVKNKVLLKVSKPKNDDMLKGIIP